MAESVTFKKNLRLEKKANTHRNQPAFDSELTYPESATDLLEEEISDSRADVDLSNEESVLNSPMQTVLLHAPTTRSTAVSTAFLPVYLRTIGTPSVTYLTAKRSVDILISATLLILLIPLFLIVGLLIKLTDGGPVFFRQSRVGIRGKEFFFNKFRSMIVNAEAMKQEILKLNKHRNSITFKMIRDPRITWIGRILRKTSIDELPQLWNVLLGEMTLVGPRPAVPSEVARYNSHERRRLNTVPGLTCIWQVSGRADLDFRQQVDLDLKYIRERSFWLDVKLLLLTIPAVLSGKGAY
jgi:lipopolysaccharide/colanic/teichoic acid biosynthesis glycosyltransferase